MSKDIKICTICHIAINEKDNYYLIQSYKLGTYLGRKHYHWKCFNDKLRGDEELQTIKKKAMKVLDTTDKIIAGYTKWE